MRIERHIYGSVSGYETLAGSPGLSPADLRILENMSVGQISDPSFLRSLAKKPACVVRPLGGRMGLTRVFPGPPDDQGRATIRRVSVVVSREDWDEFAGDIGPLLACRELWQWDGRRDLPPLDIDLPSPGLPEITGARADKLLDLLSLLERAQIAGRPVIVRETHLGAEEFRAIELLIPVAVRGSHSAAYRAVRPDLPVNLIVLAEQAPVSASAESYRPGLSVQRSPYATALAGAGFGRNDIPLDFIRSYRSFAMPPRAATPRAPAAPPGLQMGPQVIIERMPRGVLFALIAACILLPILGSISTYYLTRRHTEAQHKAELAGFLTALIAVQPPILVSEDRKTLESIYRRMASRTGNSKEIETFTARISAIDTAEAAYLAALGKPNAADIDLQPQPAGYRKLKNIISQVACDKDQNEQAIQAQRQEVAERILGAIQPEVDVAAKSLNGRSDLTPADVLDSTLRMLRTLNAAAAEWLPNNVELDLRALTLVKQAKRRPTATRLASPASAVSPQGPVATAPVQDPKTQAPADPSPVGISADQGQEVQELQDLLSQIDSELEGAIDRCSKSNIDDEIATKQKELEETQKTRAEATKQNQQKKIEGEIKALEDAVKALEKEKEACPGRIPVIREERRKLKDLGKRLQNPQATLGAVQSLRTLLQGGNKEIQKAPSFEKARQLVNKLAQPQGRGKP